MSNKDFENGMAAGAKPYEEKTIQNQIESNKIINHIDGEWFDRYGKLLDVVLNDLRVQESQRLYDLPSALDPGEIGKAEQELLICILYTLSMHTSPTDYEKNIFRIDYLRGLQSYLGIATPRGKDAVSNLGDAIKNIDSKREEKIILQVVAEYLYLTYGNYDFLNSSEVIGYFSAVATPSFLEEVKECIGQQFRAIGPQGIANKYQNLCMSHENNTHPALKAPKAKFYVDIPRLSKKKADSSAEQKSAQKLVVKLQNSGYSCLKMQNGSDFCVYFPTSEDADSIREVFENDPMIQPVYQKYGCSIYCKGHNIFLDYSIPKELDDSMREEIVQAYDRLSTRAQSPEITTWMTRHKEKDKEDYFTQKFTQKVDITIDTASNSIKKGTSAVLGFASTSVKKFTGGTDKEKSVRSPNVLGKKAVEIASQTVGATTKLAGKVADGAGKIAVGAGNMIESVGDKSSVSHVNKHFDKEILPDIQRDFLVCWLIELIDSGKIVPKENS